MSSGSLFVGGKFAVTKSGCGLHRKEASPIRRRMKIVFRIFLFVTGVVDNALLLVKGIKFRCLI
jgi:hypothetical protein